MSQFSLLVLILELLLSLTPRMMMMMTGTTTQGELLFHLYLRLHLLHLHLLSLLQLLQLFLLLFLLHLHLLHLLHYLQFWVHLERLDRDHYNLLQNHPANLLETGDHLVNSGKFLLEFRSRPSQSLLRKLLHQSPSCLLQRMATLIAATLPLQTLSISRMVKPRLSTLSLFSRLVVISLMTNS